MLESATIYLWKLASLTKIGHNFDPIKQNAIYLWKLASWPKMAIILTQFAVTANVRKCYIPVETCFLDQRWP